MLARLTIRPPAGLSPDVSPPSRIAFTTSRQQSHTPSTLIRWTLRKSSRLNSPIGPRTFTPALLTSTPGTPSSSTQRATMPATAASSVTSAARPSVFTGYSAAILSAAASASAAWRLVSSTFAPALARPAAIVSPSPFDPPVTIAVRPVRSNWTTPGQRGAGRSAAVESVIRASFRSKSL